MSKFKVGDRVVRIQGKWMTGAVGTILDCDKRNRDYLIKLDKEYEHFLDDVGKNWGWNEDYIELEEIYNSELYKAMEENEEL